MEQKTRVLLKEFILLVLTFMVGSMFWLSLVYEHTLSTCIIAVLAAYTLECGIIGALSHGLVEKQIPTFKLISVCCLAVICILMLATVVYRDLYFLLQLLVIGGFIAGVICAMFMIRLNHIIDCRGYYHVKNTANENTKFAGLKHYPVWHGKSPEKVADFAVPRYVYENMAETKKPTAKNGRIIGYRIGPELVIRSAISPAKGWNKGDISAFIEHFGGKLLNHQDANILRRYWDIVSEMRLAAGETPLPLPYFWYQDEYGIASGHYREDFNEVDPTQSAVILKF